MRSHRHGHRRSALALALALGLVACGNGSGAGDGGSGASGGGSPTVQTPVARPSSPAQLSIRSPRNGDVIQGSTVDLRVGLQDATIVPQTTTDISPDEGHLHVLLDEELISMTEGLEQTIADVAPGSHRLTVEFVASDHAPFDPRVVIVVAFEVRA